MPLFLCSIKIILPKKNACVNLCNFIALLHMNFLLRLNMKRTIQKKQKKAFALVMALALMGFMVLLIVSLATMVSLQMKLNKQTMSTFKAKQAAKFSAYQAMGQIQSTLGPDQRISINAAMLSKSVHSGIEELDSDSNFDWWSSPMNIKRNDAEGIDGPVAQNKYWVGVLHSKHGYHPDKQKRGEDREAFTSQIMDKAVTWLVSDNGFASEDEVRSGTNTESVKHRPDSPLREDELIRVVTKNSYNPEGQNDGSNDVVVPIVTLQDDKDTITGIKRDKTTQTRIAWWVADEGQKASLNAIASYEYKKHAESIKYRVQSLPFYSGVQGLTYGESGEKMFDINLDDDGNNSSGMMLARNATSLDQFDMLSVQPDRQPSKILFHAATCDSKGLLVNVRDGGLKKDLSLGLIQLNGEDDANAKTTDSPIDKIPEYFPRPYGVSGYFRKTTAYPIRWLEDDSAWRNERRERKPELTDEKYIGQREFAGHIFGPQMFGREDSDQLKIHLKQSFGPNAVDDWNKIFSDEMLWKDPGGALWDQLRSYYNLRSPDKPEDSEMSARVQTDDRYGAKPVVKRFQVHYVPSLVDYGNERYGLRLHIIPMLVLWNPYDTKIGEKTYYVIRVSARDFKEYHNPIGSFRFAIGYLSGNNYFQSLRDLYTERMKFPAVTPTGANQFRAADRKEFMRNCYTISNHGLFKNAANNQYSTYNGDYTYRYDPYHNKNSGFTGARNQNEDWRMSMYSPTYLTHISGKQASWMPLGYGSTAPHFIQIKQLDEKVSVVNDVNYKVRSTIFPKDIAASGYDVGDSRNWVAIVAEDNLDQSNYSQIMYPSVKKMSDWKISSRKTNESEMTTFGRVARIPLFLNNLYANLCHGSHASRVTYGNDVLFFAQRSIDAINTDSSNFSNVEGQSDSIMQSPDLHFMAYDEKGLESGATKVFAMKRPVNYFGNFKSETSNNGRNGPNGIIESIEKQGKLPYEYLDAMMLPVGEGGGTLGGCFYVDVPHPELEHYAKYETDNKPDVIIGGTYEQDSVSVQTLDNPYILFDLNEIRKVKHVDINGRSTASLNAANILIDMEDTSIFPNVDINGGRITPYKMSVGSTPLGYGTSRWGTGYNTVQGNASDTYHELQVSIWIYKREGMTFEKLRPRSKSDSNSKWGGDYPDYVPLLAFFKGRRNFMGPTFPSFPNPAMVYADGVEDSNWRYNNWSTPGYVSRNRGGGGGTNRGNLASLTPPTNQYREIDEHITGNLKTYNEKFTNIIKKFKDNQEQAETDWKNLSRAEKIYFNTRGFLNWLPINPRRHSANAWPFTPTRVKDEIGDMIPVSRALYPIKLSMNDATSNGYASKLNNYLQSDSKYIPYGYIFGIPYADDDSISESGAKPIHNRRLFVNGSLLTTYYNSDYNAQEVSDNERSLRNRTWGLSIKSVIATSIVLNHTEDANNRSPGYGLSQMGYKIPSSSDSTAYVGLSHKQGTDVNAMHHILRENEVVHNIANLSAANLNFGAGKWDSTSNWEGGTAEFSQELNSQRPWRYSYGMFSPESSMTSMAIGNSLCPSRVCPEYTYQVLWLDQSSTTNNYSNTKCDAKGEVVGKREEADEKNVVYDLSWHLNDALWDEYFFSTLPYRVKEQPHNFNEGKKVATPQNPRIQYVCSHHDDDTLSLADLKYSKEESDKQFDGNAAKLWINGPFNVNSTSVDAWKAILSTYYGQAIEGYEGNTSDNRASAPFHRWQAPLNATRQATSNTNITQEETIFTGYRALSDAEIEELAVSIVEHIKDRGPFYSMSDFVNRLAANYSAEEKFAYKNAQEDDLLNLENQKERITENNIAQLMKSGGETYRIGHTQKGVLQAAIDATSINSAYHKRYVIGGDIESLNSSWKEDNVYKYFKDEKEVWENWRAIVGPAATGAPTYLMQQDILSRLGSIMTVRSDTFKIRAYGEVRNPISGVVESKAWCEMVVQRTPEYIDNSSDTGNEPTDVYGREKELGYQPESLTGYNEVYNADNGGLKRINQVLGRRFKVVSFRWLKDNEI